MKKEKKINILIYIYIYVYFISYRNSVKTFLKLIVN